jgi:hypothetical protein
VIDERGEGPCSRPARRREVPKPAKPGESSSRSAEGPSLRFAAGGSDTDGFIYWSPGLRGLPFKKVKESFE